MSLLEHMSFFFDQLGCVHLFFPLLLVRCCKIMCTKSKYSIFSAIVIYWIVAVSVAKEGLPYYFATTHYIHEGWYFLLLLCWWTLLFLSVMEICRLTVHKDEKSGQPNKTNLLMNRNNALIFWINIFFTIILMLPFFIFEFELLFTSHRLRELVYEYAFYLSVYGLFHVSLLTVFVLALAQDRYIVSIFCLNFFTRIITNACFILNCWLISQISIEFLILNIFLFIICIALNIPTIAIAYSHAKNFSVDSVNLLSNNNYNQLQLQNDLDINRDIDHTINNSNQLQYIDTEFDMPLLLTSANVDSLNFDAGINSQLQKTNTDINKNTESQTDSDNHSPAESPKNQKAMAKHQAQPSLQDLKLKIQMSHKMINKKAKQLNTNAQTLIAAINAVTSIIVTSVVLCYEWGSDHHCYYKSGAKDPQCLNDNTKMNFANCTNADESHVPCVNHVTNDYQLECIYSFEHECTIGMITIGIGIIVLFVIGFRMGVSKAEKIAQLKQGSIWYMIIWSLKDDNLRGIILLKFLYFLIKPILVAVTTVGDEYDDNTTSIAEAFQFLFLGLMFCSITALAYVTFNKKYRLISCLNGIINNASLLARTYIISYLLNVFESYLIYIIIFTFSVTPDLNHYHWKYVMYPQCGWMLFSKLYLNEISQIINHLEKIQIKMNQSKNNDDNESIVTIVSVTVDIQQKLGKLVSRLFLFQFSAWLAAIFAIIAYISFIATGQTIRKDNESMHWVWIWYCQCFIAVVVVVVFSFSIKATLVRRVVI